MQQPIVADLQAPARSQDKPSARGTPAPCSASRLDPYGNNRPGGDQKNCNRSQPPSCLWSSPWGLPVRFTAGFAGVPNRATTRPSFAM